MENLFFPFHSFINISNESQDYKNFENVYNKLISEENEINLVEDQKIEELKFLLNYLKLKKKKILQNYEELLLENSMKPKIINFPTSIEYNENFIVSSYLGFDCFLKNKDNEI